MKRIAQSVLFFSLAASGAAIAQDRYNDPRYGHAGSEFNNLRSDVARVTSVERVASSGDSYLRQECWNERTRRNESGYYRDGSGRLYRGDGRGNTSGALIGAIIGGAIGNRFGHGDGRAAATVAGVVVGGAIGNNSGRSDGYDRYSGDSGVELRCRTVSDGGNYFDAYRVTYTYAGQSYQAITDVNPGRRLRVTVDVRPQAGGFDHRR